MNATTEREGWIRTGYIAAVFLVSIPVAFLAPDFAPYIWLLLFFDPSARLAARFSPGPV